jgi:UDP-N-acetylmuramoyl-tripeptide--D-alanyl-D-alanine ligase
VPGSHLRLVAGLHDPAENISCVWPDRLSFDIIHDGQRHTVQTQLCGVHWVPCVLAAIGTALEMGITLADAARAVARVPPTDRRMAPMTRPDGVTSIRDDIKASLGSVGPALDFMRVAKASRKIVVIGTISDYAGNSETMYKRVARLALDTVDIVIFVGPKSSKCAKVKNDPKGDALWMFPSVEQAREHLASVLQPGELVLLKGSERADRFERLCSVEESRRSLQTHEDETFLHGISGPLVTPNSTAGSFAGNGLGERQETQCDAAPRRRSQTVVAVVGLGNAGEEYSGTPHNVGHRALDGLAHSFQAEWKRIPDALVASTEWGGMMLYLIKPMTSINSSGSVLVRLAREGGFGPEECLLVHDDMDRPLGAIRVRVKGSDGGHRGVRSMVQAFGTASLARVKIGVGRPAQQVKAADHILSPFSPSELTLIDNACAEITGEVTKWLHSRRTSIRQTSA